ncbi:uncharacterized protein TrAtP1_011398 [Trichoderma atroviride]|uniref:uncharacterized protein n=1 Tax=Hypocrea atroviridis TaxID=63577 RepID=UPI00333450DE|nr:hypothetical protein TrAtP1_011398 [Trichoderma atroviride]
MTGTRPPLPYRESAYLCTTCKYTPCLDKLTAVYPRPSLRIIPSDASHLPGCAWQEKK